MKSLTWVFLAIAVAAHAQDVTVTPTVWLRQDPAPDKLPERRHGTLPSYPAEVRKSGEIGYVLFEQHINPDGKAFSYVRSGSQVALLRAVLDDPWITAMKPALQAGQPVAADVWWAYVFNPASSAADAPNATPRLLRPTPIAVPPKLLAPIRDNPVVRVRLEIDATGTVSAAAVESPADAPFLKAIQEATAQWRFSPARQGGQPVAAAVSLPVVLSRVPSEAFAQGEVTPARIIKRVAPFYPPALRYSRMRGEVTVGFVVDEKGQVQNVTIQSSNNPGFEEEAMKAVQKWKFEPARKAGKPFATHMQVAIVFQHMMENHDAFAVQTGSQDGLPEQFRYDTPAKIRGTINPVYPYELLRDNVSGSATVIILIDPAGKVAKTQVVEASAPQFGLALSAALEMYQFDPALKNGRPTQSLVKREQSFSLNMGTPGLPGNGPGFDAVLLPFNVGLPTVRGGDVLGDYQLLHRLEAHPDRVVNARSLDRPLRPVSRRAPVFPANLVQKTDHGSALVEIIIDPDGHARIPRVLSATDPAFGYAAVQAVEYWSFDPPKAGGKTVYTRIQIPFNFSVARS